jgi:hypothetical protein
MLCGPGRLALFPLAKVRKDEIMAVQGILRSSQYARKIFYYR